MMEFGREQKDF